MSFMPNPGSRVLLKSGHYAIITKVTPDGQGDRAVLVNGNAPMIGLNAWDIAEIIDEPEPKKGDSSE